MRALRQARELPRVVRLKGDVDPMVPGYLTEQVNDLNIEIPKPVAASD